MFQRIGFRLLLPVMNLALCVALVCTGNPASRNPSAMSSSLDNANTPVRLEFVLGVNLPALLPVLVAHIAMPGLNKNFEVWLAIPFTLVLWFLVGSWMDRRLGLIHSRRPKRTFIRDWALVAFCIVASLAFVLLIKVMHVAVPTPGHPRDVRWIGYSISGWYLLFLGTLAGMCWDRFFQPNRQ